MCTLTSVILKYLIVGIFSGWVNVITIISLKNIKLKKELKFNKYTESIYDIGESFYNG